MSSLPTHGDVIRRRLRGHHTNDNSNVDNDAAEDNDDGGGISGPRRGTIQPAPSTAHDDMVADAANAAAMAVAHDIGLMSPSSPAIVAASSTRRGAASTAIDNAPSGASSSGGGIGIRGFLSRRSRSLTGSRSSDDTSTATATTSDFVPLGDDVNPDRHNNDSNTISHSYSKQSSSNHLFIQSSHVYIPPPATTTTNNNTNNNQQQHDVIIKPSPSMISTSADSLTSLHVYDTHGQRAPYYDGPYLITADPDGTRRRRRWCKLFFFQNNTVFFDFVVILCCVPFFDLICTFEFFKFRIFQNLFFCPFLLHFPIITILT